MVRRTVTLLALVLVATGSIGQGDTEADRRTPPKQGACRELDADDLAQSSNASPVVSCAKPHTAQTFAVGTLPSDTGSSYADPRHGTFVYQACTQAFRDFVGLDESLAMRVQLSWAWFRPSKRGCSGAPIRA